MKILFITGAEPPLKDGIGDYTVRLIDTLKKSSVLEVEVISSKDIRSWNIFGVADIACRVKDKDIDVVHIQYPSSKFRRTIALAFLPLFIKLISPKIKVITTLHEFSISYPINRLRQLVLGLFSDKVVVSDANEFKRLAGSWPGAFIKNKLVVIPIGSNIDVYEADAAKREKFFKEHRLEPKAVIVSFFGFIHKNKGLEALLTALAELKRKKIPAFLLLIGELKPADPYHRHIRNLIDFLGLEGSVYLTGYRPPEEISEFLSLSDICVLPFLDGISLRRTTLITALSHGLAVITTRVGDYVPNGVIDGRNIILVPPEDKNALVEAIISLGNDNVLRKKMGTAAKQFSERFLWDNIAARHIELYKNLTV